LEVNQRKRAVKALKEPERTNMHCWSYYNNKARLEQRLKHLNFDIN